MVESQPWRSHFFEFRTVGAGESESSIAEAMAAFLARRDVETGEILDAVRSLTLREAQ